VFTIDIEDRSISCQPERIVGGLNFDSQEGLLSLAADRGWGKEEMTAIWNGFAGTPEFNDCREQKCFRNRNYAVERIWAAIQRLSQPVTAHGNGHKPLVITASESAAETAPAGAQGASAATEGQEAGETTSQSDEAPLHAAPVGDGKQIEDMIVVPRKRNKKTKEPKAKTPKAPKQIKVKESVPDARTKYAAESAIHLLDGKEAPYRGKRLAIFKLMKEGMTVAKYRASVEKATPPSGPSVATSRLRTACGKPCGTV